MIIFTFTLVFLFSGRCQFTEIALPYLGTFFVVQDMYISVLSLLNQMPGSLSVECSPKLTMFAHPRTVPRGVMSNESS